jgi:hypothetical protein
VSRAQSETAAQAKGSAVLRQIIVDLVAILVLEHVPQPRMVNPLVPAVRAVRRAHPMRLA